MATLPANGKRVSMGDGPPCADQPTWEDSDDDMDPKPNGGRRAPGKKPKKASAEEVAAFQAAAKEARAAAEAEAKAKPLAAANAGEQFEKVLKIAVDSVQHELGLGLTEAIYRNALAIKMRYVGYTTSIEVPVPVVYSGETVGTIRADLVSYDKDGKHHIVELKVAAKITAAHVTQAKAYLKRSPDGSTAYVVNFGPEEVETYTI